MNEEALALWGLLRRKQNKTLSGYEPILPHLQCVAYSLYSGYFIECTTNPLVVIFPERSQFSFSFRCSPVETHKIHFYMERNLLANVVVNTFGIFTHTKHRSNVIVWELQTLVVGPSCSYFVRIIYTRC